MAEQNPPVWMQSGTYNAIDDRLVTGLLSDRDRGSSGNGTGILGGVVPGFSQLAITANNSNMQISIATGTVIVPSRGVNPPGAYICHNQGAKTMSLDIEASGNPRIDLVYVEVSDQTAGGSTNSWTIGVQKGSPSASPVTPPLLNGRFPLASIRVVPASMNGGVNKITTAQIKDLRRFNTALGGVHLTRNGLPNPAPAPGRLLYNTDSNYLYINHGTAQWHYFLTYQDWMKIFASLRPKHTVISALATIPDGSGRTDKWYASPPRRSDGKAIPPVQLSNIQSPSGRFKVTISSFGRMDQSSGTGHATGSGHISLRVLKGTKSLYPPAATWRAISFYGRAWEHHGTTFLVNGQPANTKLNFRLEFRRTGEHDNAFHFSNTYLMVEPLL